MAGSGRYRRSSRTNSYGNDIWIAHVVREYWARRVDPNTLSEEQFVPFYDAAWELCRIGVLRPGQHAAMGQGQYGGAIFSGDGYSITEFGAKWLADPERQTGADPSRMSEIFASFSETYGTGFSQRATEAIRCHRTSNYLASCVMAGAAAESILLAVAIAKAKDEEKVLKTYEKSGGRLAVTRLVTTGLFGSVQRQFEAALQVLHYWRDDAAHGKATAISEVEAHASLTQLLRLAHFSHDNWAELTS
jgi:hypothetical protein